MDVKYRLTPSLLKSFSDFLRSDEIAEEDWNKVSEEAIEKGEFPGAHPGDYRLTPDEMALKLEADLLNSINRSDRTPSEAADKGTAFNEIVDCLIENRGSSRDDCRIKSVRNREGVTVVRAEINGFTFVFDLDLCQDVAAACAGSIPQYLCSAVMETDYGPVELYGYIDEWMGGKMCDLKTTGKYTFGKYGDGWQHLLYPWAAIESGMATEVEDFTYLVVEWAYQAKGKPLKAKNIYEEVYSYDHEESGRRLREIAERMIGWLESRRSLIDDPKIFGGERPDGFKGRYITIEMLKNFKN